MVGRTYLISMILTSLFSKSAFKCRHRFAAKAEDVVEGDQGPPSQKTRHEDMRQGLALVIGQVSPAVWTVPVPVPGGTLATPHTAAVLGHGPGPGTRTVREHTMATKLYKRNV